MLSRPSNFLLSACGNSVQKADDTLSCRVRPPRMSRVVLSPFRVRQRLTHGEQGSVLETGVQHPGGYGLYLARYPIERQENSLNNRQVFDRQLVEYLNHIGQHLRTNPRIYPDPENLIHDEIRVF